MFDLDLGKLFVFGAVALVVVGPKDLPVAMRAMARILGQMRRIQTDIQTTARKFMAEGDLDRVGRDLAGVETGAWSNIALNPATAMRGGLAAATGSVAQGPTDEDVYASPEMQSYLASPTQAAAEAAPVRTSASQSSTCTEAAIGLSRKV